MNEMLLAILLSAHHGPLRLEGMATGYQAGIQPSATAGRLTLEWPSGSVRPFTSVGAARYGTRDEVDVTLRSGLVTGDATRLSVGTMATDLEAEDGDGGPRAWAFVEFTVNL